MEYVYVSPSEFYNYEVDVSTLNALLTPVYQSDDGSYLIYSVPEKFREQAHPSAPDTTVSPVPTQDPSQDPNSEG